jgi:hypothetical protein
MLSRGKGREIKDAGAHNSVIGGIYRVVLVNTLLKFDENTGTRARDDGWPKSIPPVLPPMIGKNQ